MTLEFEVLDASMEHALIYLADACLSETSREHFAQELSFRGAVAGAEKSRPELIRPVLEIHRQR